MGIPGTVNDALPDNTLRYVPFTYAGTVNAYKLTSETATTEEYAQQNKYPHSLFIADYNVTFNVDWNQLNEKQMIFGTPYDRPGFQAMLAEIEAGRVAVAITKDLSRLGRNSALTGLYTNFTFLQNGVRFIAINDNYDTIDPNRVDNDFAGIKNWFNDSLA